jgi:hypothetical protein
MTHGLTAASVAAAVTILQAMVGCQPQGSPSSSNADGGAVAPTPSAGGPGFCENGWCWTHPLPQGNGILAIHGIDDDDVWAVGAGGTALRWDGRRWARIATGSRDDLTGVWAAARDDVWAVGGLLGDLLHFDGSRWQLVERPGPRTGFKSLHGSGPRDLWAVGGAALALHWNGSTWTERRPPTEIMTDLQAVYALGPDLAWAAGRDSSFYRWDGNAWSPLRGPDRAIHSLWAAASNDLWAIAGNQAFRWDGGSWTMVRQWASATGSERVFGRGRDDVWFAHEQLDRWNGASWQSLSVSAFAGWASRSRVYLGGRAGLLARTDGTRVDTDSAEVTRGVLRAIWSDGKGEVLAAGRDFIRRSNGV